MTSAQLELGWPLPGELGRRFARRLRRHLTLVLVLLGAGLPGLAVLDQPGLDPVARWGEMALWTAGVLVVAPLLALGVVEITGRFLRGWLADVVRAVGPGLASGERVLGAVAVMVLERTYSTAWWVLTDRRSLLFRAPPSGLAGRALGLHMSAQVAELCPWSELAAVELVRRRATRVWLVGELLRLANSDRGLRLRARDGRAWFLVGGSEGLEAVIEWLRPRGLEAQEVDDADLAGPELTPLEFAPITPAPPGAG